MLQVREVILGRMVRYSILRCNILGNDVEKGLLPNDQEILSRMVEDISYNNARRYFKFY